MRTLHVARILDNHVVVHGDIGLAVSVVHLLVVIVVVITN
jgi:hypothetical protein